MKRPSEGNQHIGIRPGDRKKLSGERVLTTGHCGPLNITITLLLLSLLHIPPYSLFTLSLFSSSLTLLCLKKEAHQIPPVTEEVSVILIFIHRFCFTLFHLVSKTVSLLPLRSFIHFSLQSSSLPLALLLLNNWTLIHRSGVNFYLPPLAEVYCLRAVLEVRSSDAAHIIFNLPSIFIGPKLLHLISHYYILLSIQNRSTVQPFWLPSHRFSSPTSRLSHFLSGAQTKEVLWLQNFRNFIRG